MVREGTASFLPGRVLKQHSSLCLILVAENKMYLGPQEHEHRKLWDQLTLTHAVSWAVPQKGPSQSPFYAPSTVLRVGDSMVSKKRQELALLEITVLCWRQNLIK